MRPLASHKVRGILSAQTLPLDINLPPLYTIHSLTFPSSHYFIIHPLCRPPTPSSYKPDITSLHLTFEIDYRY